MYYTALQCKSGPCFSVTRAGCSSAPLPPPQRKARAASEEIMGSKTTRRVLVSVVIAYKEARICCGGKAHGSGQGRWGKSECRRISHRLAQPWWEGRQEEEGGAACAPARNWLRRREAGTSRVQTKTARRRRVHPQGTSAYQRAAAHAQSSSVRSIQSSESQN